ncbi:MAG TPA: adenylate/guanylate cyclase domain-containing protein [Deltaproteobacteria bacterium]|nr:adenylate/guanylate cyclase domain-containing protein [Deltaproteobacteria bacterium]
MPVPAMRGLSHSLRLTPFAAGCVAILVSCLIFHGLGDSKPELLTSLDNQISSAMFRWRGPMPTTGAVVIVDIDEKSLGRIGQWPWRRDIMASLVRRVKDSGARVIGFDIVFPEPDRTSPGLYLEDFRHMLGHRLTAKDLNWLSGREDLDHDRMLGAALSEAPTVLGYIFQLKDDGLKSMHERPFPALELAVRPEAVSMGDLSLVGAYRPILNVPEVSQGRSEGFLNVFPDPSGTVHRVPLFMALDGMPYPSLALEITRIGLGLDTATVHASQDNTPDRASIIGVSLADRFIPTDTTGQITLNYRGPVGTFPSVSAVDILEGRNGGELRGKYVIIGTSAAGIPDFHATPFSAICPGIEVQATAVDNMLEGDLYSYDAYTEIGLTYTVIFAGGLALSAILAFGGALAGGIAGLVLLGGLLYADYSLFFLHNRLMGVTYPFLTLIGVYLVVTLTNYLSEHRKKQFIHDAFSRYVSPAVVSQLMKSPESLKIEGQQKNLTMLFSDIRDFTSISEGLHPEQLAQFMNTYLTAMSDIIMNNSGTVDKYIGDAIVALWGAPVDDPDHAVHAVRASLQMLKALDGLNERWASQGLPAISMRIGINTGVVRVGNFGSERRFEYTAIGDNMNLASRLEGLNKVYHTAVIISEHTKNALGDAVFCRILDRVRVKGKTVPIDIYEPIMEGAPDPRLLHEVERFEAAFRLSQRGDFVRACEEMRSLASLSPSPVYSLHLCRMEAFVKAGPPPGWDGAVSFEEK